jgi:hypothetical protein
MQFIRAKIHKVDSIAFLSAAVLEFPALVVERDYTPGIQLNISYPPVQAA